VYLEPLIRNGPWKLLIEFSEITQNKAMTPFKVIQGHRSWYQSKAHVRLPISVNSLLQFNLPPTLYRFQVMAYLLVKFSLATGEFLTLRPSLGLSLANV